MSARDEAARRWRLALGRHASGQFGGLSRRDQRADRVLGYLYEREVRARGGARARGPGSLDPTQLTAINWLGQARSLFPESAFDTLQRHALERYEIEDLLRDPAVLDALEPDASTLKALLGIHGRAQPAVQDKLRRVARAVIEELTQRLKASVERAFGGARNPHARSRLSSAANFDWHGTVRENLQTYDPERGVLVPERLRFVARERRRLPWTVILLVDQSGSMTDSLIHSAVMAAILSGLPGVRCKMVLFDTGVVDVTDRLADPLDTLLSVQLGGGTDIGRAVAYAEGLVEDPGRTVLALVSDMAEGAPPRRLYAGVARLAEARVTMVGLPALDETGEAACDRLVADRLAGLGMRIGAMTPDRFAGWLADIMA